MVRLGIEQRHLVNFTICKVNVRMKLPNGVDRYPALEIGFRVQMYTALGVPPKPKGVPAHIFMNMTYSSEKMDFFAAARGGAG